MGIKSCRLFLLPPQLQTEMTEQAICNIRPADMPNQEEFKNLMVEPADIRQSCNSWETSKKIKVHSKQTSKEPIGNNPELGEQQELESDSASNLNLANSDSIEHLESSDDHCEIITFMIGGASVRDSSKPMPPPSRFVRKGETTSNKLE